MQWTRHLALLIMPALTLALISPLCADARPLHLNARSAILVNMEDGAVLFEQNANSPIAPASITKVLSLFLVFDAVRQGEARLWDTVRVSQRAATTGGSRMGLRKGDQVPLGEIIKGMAVVSGNDACVAVAEHLSGDVESFVRKMNRKARELGMTSSVFKTPNGLPAPGQVTTARDIALLSMAYLSKYPESLHIHSMETYAYRNATRRNANRLLGKCPGVDGLKTGFVNASGYNLSATAKRSGTRLIAVVLGTQSAAVRARETERLLEYGFDLLQGGPPSLNAGSMSKGLLLASGRGEGGTGLTGFNGETASAAVCVHGTDAKKLTASKRGAQPRVSKGSPSVRSASVKPSGAAASTSGKVSRNAGKASVSAKAGQRAVQNQGTRTAAKNVKKSSAVQGAGNKTTASRVTSAQNEKKSVASVQTRQVATAAAKKSPENVKGTGGRTEKSSGTVQKQHTTSMEPRKKALSRKDPEGSKTKNSGSSATGKDKRASSTFIRSAIPSPRDV